MVDRKSINLSMNDLAFYWSFPEIVAFERKFYQEEELDVTIHNITPAAKVPNKSKMYMDLLERGRSDLYHAAEWVSIGRVVASPESRIIAWSPWVVGGLNASFGLYSKPEVKEQGLESLKGKEIAVEEGTGSYYTTIEDLEKYLPVDSINLKKVGDPHERLLLTLNGDVSASSLLGVYTDLAVQVGLVQVLESRRRKGTVMVSRKGIERDVLLKFISATNRAIEAINRDPDGHRDLYFSKVKVILERFPDPIKRQGLELKDSINIPKWAKWEPYPKQRFDEAYSWMEERKMIEGGFSYEMVSSLQAF